MRLKKTTLCAMAMLLVVGFYGNVWAGGGPEDPACLTGELPAPDSGEFLRGNFIVAMDQNLSPDHYNALFILKYDDGEIDGELVYHMYSLALPIEGSKNLCDFTDAELETIFERKPCSLDVGDDFGLDGMPVIKKIRVKKWDNCETTANPKSMIKGRVVVRVVPDPPAAP